MSSRVPAASSSDLEGQETRFLRILTHSTLLNVLNFARLRSPSAGSMPDEAAGPRVNRARPSEQARSGQALTGRDPKEQEHWR